MAFTRISILGVGLLGGSIGLAVKSKLNNVHVKGYGHRKATVDAAVNIGALDEGFTEMEPAVRDAELIVLCTPVGLFRSLLAEISPLLGSATVVTDVGSTKRSIVAAAGELLPNPRLFVGSHPMAGSEKRGVQFARADLYDDALCILTPTAVTDAESLSDVDEFWRSLGMRTCRISPEEHDRRLSDVSHLPHALAAALVAMQEEESFPLAGKGFHDMTRIAGGDGGLWRDIYLDNRDNVGLSISRLKDRLDHLLSLMDHDDGKGLQQWLDSVADQREKMAGKK